MADVEFRALSKSFGETPVLHALDLRVSSGEFIAVVGPSGCGKSTLLRLLAGLEVPNSGQISIGGRVVNNLSPGQRDVGMVFQSYALYPHFTVRQNIAFPLRMQGLDSKAIATRLGEVAEMLDLTSLLDRKPAQLSGGQKQRVAMARAIVKQPKVLLFDEPLSNLDAQLRTRVRSEIAQLHRRLRSTVIYVTHDQVEAMTLADRVAVLHKGRLEQFAAPLELYSRPATSFVASFIGTPPMNLLPVGDRSAPAGAATLGFRPEHTSLGSGSTPSLGRGTVTLLERLGNTTHVHLLLGGTSLTAIANEAPAIGSDVEVRASEVYHFDAKGLRL